MCLKKQDIEKWYGISVIALTIAGTAFLITATCVMGLLILAPFY